MDEETPESEEEEELTNEIKDNEVQNTMVANYTINQSISKLSQLDGKFDNLKPI